MGAILSGFPARPRDSQTVTLAGAQHVVRFTWRPRLDAWYVDLHTVEGVPLVVGRRMSAGWAPFVGLRIEGLPTGLLYVRGSDGYARGDLGGNLRLVHYTDEEVAQGAPETTEDALIVVIA
jgi:hypothetical protein